VPTSHAKQLSCFAASSIFTIMIAQIALAVDRPWIGMDITDCRFDGTVVGVAVLRIEEDAPARSAGISAGDIVIAMDGQPLTSANDFICKVIALSPGQRVRLTVLHDGTLLAPVVTLGMWPLHIPQGRHSCPENVSHLRVGMIPS
jgi:S1-C subfamily serine protease